MAKSKYNRMSTNEYYTLLMQCFQELHEEESIKFKVEFLNAEKLKEAKEKGDLLERMRLVSKISTRNMNLIDHNGDVVKPNSAEDGKLLIIVVIL
jgi:hypothetical protein